MREGNFTEEYVVRKDAFGRTIIRRIPPNFLLFILALVVIISVIIFPLLPFGIALWGRSLPEPKKRLSAACLSLFTFIYMLFDISSGWFIPQIFGTFDFSEMEFSHGSIHSPIPLIIISMLDLAGLALSISLINRYFDPVIKKSH